MDLILPFWCGSLLQRDESPAQILRRARLWSRTTLMRAYASARIPRTLTIPSLRLVARSIGTIAPVAVPVTAVAPVGLMTANQTPSARSEEAMVPGDMTGNAANHGTLHAAVARICWAGRQTDGGQDRGCRNDH